MAYKVNPIIDPYGEVVRRSDILFGGREIVNLRDDDSDRLQTWRGCFILLHCLKRCVVVIQCSISIRGPVKDGGVEFSPQSRAINLG